MTMLRVTQLVNILKRVPLSGASRDVLVDTAMYSFGPVLKGIGGIVLLKTVTSHLTPGELAQTDTIISLLATLSGIMVLGLDQAAGRIYFDDITQDERRSVLSTAAVIITLTSILAGILLLPVCQIVAAHLLHSPASAILVLLALPLLPLRNLRDYLSHILRWSRRRFSYTTLETFSLVARVALVSLGAALYGPEGVVLGTVLACIPAVLLGVVLARNDVALTFDRRHIRGMLQFGLPMMGPNLLVLVSGLLDRVFLIHLYSETASGYYIAGLQMASVYEMLSQGFRLAWGPVVASFWDDTERVQREFPRLFMTYLVVGGVAIAVLSAAAPYLARILVDPAFYPGHTVIGAIALGFLTRDLAALLGMPLIRAKRARTIAVASVTTLFVLILGHFSLTPRYGPAGAAIAGVIAHGAGFVVIVVTAQRIARLPYNWTFLFLLYLVSAIAPVLLLAD